MGSGEEFSRLAALLPEPMLLVTGEGAVLAANRASADLLGHPSGDRLVGRRLMDLGDQDTGRVEEWLRACSRSKTLVPGFLTFRRVGGSPVRCRADGAAYWPASAGDAATVLVRLTPGQQVEQRKDEFLAMLAHELRNPLAPLRSGIEVLRMEANAPDQFHRVSEMMDRQVRHLTRIVDDLLNVSRITRGRIDLRREPMDLIPVIEHAMEMVEERSFMDGTVEVTLHMPPDALWLDGDATRLSQVFVNLISNAVKFTDPGGRVTVTAGPDESGGEGITVSVRDTGAGIQAEDLADIFDLFVQTDLSLDREKGGLGLGLPVARRLTELHGGTLEARSEGLGKGSEFIVSLPSLPALDARSPQEAAPGSRSDGEDRAPGRRCVLIVDDNRDAAEVLGMLVDHWGHDIALAHDGIHALEVAARSRPDVVLMDLGLPRLDGYEVARRIRVDPELAGALLIAVSGYGPLEDQGRAKAAGFDHHLVKPVDPKVLKILLVSSRA